MLSRKNLIPLKAEFSRIRREAKSYDSPSFGLLISYRTGKSEPASTAKRGEQETVNNPQGAFIVSKKIDRRSVVRHQVKRKLADAVSSLLPRLPKNLELVFLAKQKAIETTREELRNELQLVLRRARLLF